MNIFDTADAFLFVRVKGPSCFSNVLLLTVPTRYAVYRAFACQW